MPRNINESILKERIEYLLRLRGMTAQRVSIEAKKSNGFVRDILAGKVKQQAGSPDPDQHCRKYVPDRTFAYLVSNPMNHVVRDCRKSAKGAPVRQPPGNS